MRFDGVPCRVDHQEADVSRKEVSERREPAGLLGESALAEYADMLICLPS